jgi:hypothetical protein
VPITDVGKAEGVVELLEFPECVLDMVVVALLDAGCDARAAALIAKYPQKSRRKWVKMAAAALLGPGEEALTLLSGRLHVKVDLMMIVWRCAKVLTRAGRGSVAEFLKYEFPLGRMQQELIFDKPRAVASRPSFAAAFRCETARRRDWLCGVVFRRGGSEIFGTGNDSLLRKVIGRESTVGLTRRDIASVMCAQEERQ